MRLVITGSEHAAWDLLVLTGPQEFTDHVAGKLETVPWEGLSELDLLTEVGMVGLVPEIRHRQELWGADSVELLSLVAVQGNLHAHSVDSDGLSDLEEMAAEEAASRDRAREYRKFKRPFRAVCGVAGGGTRVGLGVSWALSRGLWAG